MSNKQRNYTKELDLIINGLDDSIIELSDEEVKSELIEMNEYPDIIPNYVRNLFRDADKKYRKRHLIEAKEEYKKQTSKIRAKKYCLPQSIREMRKLLSDLLNARPELRPVLTFQNRNFEDLPDEDIENALKSLIELGLLKDSNNDSENE